MVTKVSIEEKIREIGGKPYHPIDVAKVNNQVVRMALIRGEYHWHKHAKEDELFYVIKGRMTIRMKPPHRNITLGKGQIAVVPKGVNHCPASEEGAYVLMFEPYTLRSRGD